MERCRGRVGVGNPDTMYQPYIDGLKEIRVINQEYAARYLRG